MFAAYLFKKYQTCLDTFFSLWESRANSYTPASAFPSTAGMANIFSHSVEHLFLRAPMLLPSASLIMCLITIPAIFRNVLINCLNRRCLLSRSHPCTSSSVSIRMDRVATAASFSSRNVSYEGLTDDALRKYLYKKTEESKQVVSVEILDEFVQKALRTNTSDTAAKSRI